MLPPPQPADVAALLAEAGLPGAFLVEPLPGGGNNRVYRVDCGSARVLLKAYFQHAADPRDRLGTEFAFARFAWERGLRCLPRPLAQDSRRHLGLYEFIDGHALAPGNVGPAEVRQALAFFRELNRHRTHPAAAHLPYGSEACLSLGQHLACVERRVKALAGLDASTPLGRDAQQLVCQQLAPAWERLRSDVCTRAASHGLALEEALPPSDLRLSPSDFGFHNAIRAADGELRFIDFEYAGWDDPVKTVCDFACQPAVPIPAPLAEEFTHEVIGLLADPPGHQLRVALLTRVYLVKWCCILLNEFQPVGAQRRSFARQGQGLEERRTEQLHKARDVLCRITER